MERERPWRELPRKPATFAPLPLGRKGLLWPGVQILCIPRVAEWEISQVRSLRICSTIVLGRRSCSSICQVPVSPTRGDGLAFFFFSSSCFESRFKWLSWAIPEGTMVSLAYLTLASALAKASLMIVLPGLLYHGSTTSVGANGFQDSISQRQRESLSWSPPLSHRCCQA